MESSSFLSASQPTTSTAPWVFPEFAQGPSYLGPSPSTDPRLHDATNFLDLKLPPNTLQVWAQGQATGRLPVLFNGPAGQPVRTAKTFAATKRTAARSHSQPQMWKAGSASAYARGVSAAQPVSQLAEVSQFQPPPVKARVRRATRATKSTARDTMSAFSHQPAITTPSRGDGEQSASQQTFNLASAAQTAAPQVEATPSFAYAGPSAAAVLSAASWGAGGESTSMPASEPFSWATATAAEISKHCGLDSLPLGLIDKVLPRFRAFLKASGSSTSTDTEKTNTAQFPASSVSSGLTLQSPCSSGMETSELLPATQLLAQSQPHAQPTPLPPVEEPTMEVQASALTGMVPDFGSTAGIPEGSSMMEWLGWAPEAGPSTVEEPTPEPLYEAHQPSARLLTPEELDALLRDHDSAVVEPAMEDSSAALGFLLDLEHGREMEAGRSEFPMAPPTRNDAERSMPLEEGMDMGAYANFDFGQLLDNWEGWAELGCADRM